MCWKFPLCLSFSSIRNTVVLIVGMSIQVTIEQKSLKSHRQLINSVSELFMWFCLSPRLSAPSVLILFASMNFQCFVGFLMALHKIREKKTDIKLEFGSFFFFIEQMFKSKLKCFHLRQISHFYDKSSNHHRIISWLRHQGDT